MGLAERDLAIEQVTEAAATRPVIQKKTYASAMSYVGITRRITASIRRNSTSTPKAVVFWTFGIIAMLLMWAIVTSWYVVVFGIFGLLTIPFRLLRRSQRKSLHLQEQQLATMQAMLAQQKD